jgi:uncharacterized protein (TIGR03067 family)
MFFGENANACCKKVIDQMGSLLRVAAGCLLAYISVCLAGCGQSSTIGATNAAKAAGVGNCAAATAEDSRQWQGRWTLVSANWNGVPQTADAQWVVDGDHYTVRHNGSDAEVDPFKLDACKKHVDVHHHDTPKGTYGGSLKGIYEIKGDRLKVTYDPTARQYPASLESKPGTGQVAYEFRRD